MLDKEEREILKKLDIEERENPSDPPEGFIPDPNNPGKFLPDPALMRPDPEAEPPVPPADDE